MIRLSVTLALVLLSTVLPAEAKLRPASHQSDCTLTISPRSITVPAAGGSISLTVTASGPCSVSPVAAADWLGGSPIISPPGTSITYTVQPNSAQTPRVTTVDIGGVIVTITQAAAEIQNLLVNGSFDRDLNGWSTMFSTGGGDATWSALDASSSPSSGSARIRSTQGNAGFQLLQCVNVLPGRTYEYGMKERIGSGQDPAGRIVLGVYEYDVADCNKIGYNFYATATLNPPLDTWTPYGSTFSTSSTAKSLYFVVAAGFHKTPPFAINFDEAYVREKK